MRTRQLQIGNKNIVGQALMEIRKAQGLKAKEVVKLISQSCPNMDESVFSKIEGCHRGITDIELLAFSVAYNISVNDIFKMALHK